MASYSNTLTIVDSDLEAYFTSKFVNFLKDYTLTNKNVSIGVCQLNSATQLKKSITGYDALLLEMGHHPIDRAQIGAVRSSCPIVYIHNDFSLYNREVRDHVYFPWYFAQACLDSIDQASFYTKSHPGFRQNKKTYLFSCLNRNPKTERCWLYTKLHQTKFFDQTFTSFYNSFTWGDPINLEEVQKYLGGQEMQYFEKEILPYLPVGLESDLKINAEVSGFFSRDINHPAFSDAYVNIISEHLYEISFLSEKTVKPIAAEQLFLMAGPVNSIKHIEDLGFDVFRDFIDHDYYDSEPDTKTRVNRMLDAAQDLYRQNPEDIYNITETRRRQNRLHLFSNQFGNSIVAPIGNWIDRELNTY